ncbi:amidohydrolase family protein [Aggregicoccus sp. 17bor-14]|uniref:amidohydrolase family protein n=1 Tax=Myxococcaceae TaxID=31 RepID=UPI00129C7513|nr:MULTISPECIES: amidohydrolase family protein [Myxococcaceae]MBF5043093.1 amidohydrolase family protein [Simulacricoccus sp. 17bor-14]MRI88855.1 amidohydrolase family protein [Aggregicoccus sp. 17bor-14]
MTSRPHRPPALPLLAGLVLLLGAGARPAGELAPAAGAPVTSAAQASAAPASAPRASAVPTGAVPAGAVVNDVHVHLTNYVQEGIDVRGLLQVMGTKVGRAALFGIPLQQTWDYGNTGEFAPTYYLQTDAPLYYYSFTDAFIAMQYRSLPKAEQARFDPMITGFNPADMYAADHVKRVLQTFPGVFSGIGEFTIHKEFVSAKVAGETASLTNPALDRLFDFAGEVGLVVLLHNDADMPFPKPNQEPYQLAQLRALFQRHPRTTIIWAHCGLGRVVRPVKDQLALLERALAEPGLHHVFIDLSWEETAKYLVATPETTQAVAALINRYPGRFIFGTDEVAPTEQAKYLKVYDLYAPLFAKLTPEASEKVRKGNYERLFDEARRRVRAWEQAHPLGAHRTP